MPKKHDTLRGPCGGVSGRPTRERDEREKQFSFSFRLRVRNGGRHPGLRENGTLRGVSGERRSRLVRYVGAGVLPLDRTHQRQRVLEGRRGGERCRRAPCARNPARWGAIATAFWGRVLRSVLRPAHAHRHTHFTGSKNLAKVARRGTHRPPAILRKQGKRTAGRPRRDARGSQLGHHPPQEVQRGRAKRKRVAAFVQRGKCSSGWCSYVVMQLQKSLGDA